MSSATALTNLRNIEIVKLDEAAATYISARRLDFRAPYEAKSATHIGNNDFLEVMKARVYFQPDAALVVVKVGVRRFDEPSSAVKKAVDIAVRFEGAGLQAFAAGVEAAINPPAGEPDLVVRT